MVNSPARRQRGTPTWEESDMKHMDLKALALALAIGAVSAPLAAQDFAIGWYTLCCYVLVVVGIVFIFIF